MKRAAAVLPELIALPGGEFLMGDDRGRADERPAHVVALRPFRVAIAPVTNVEYDTFVAATGHAVPPFRNLSGFEEAGLPVTGIAWFDAVAYCEWMSIETGFGLRLPTEAEREYATRGGLEGKPWPWGDADPADVPGPAAIARLAQPHEPGPGCANGFGLCCMADNVHEWCADWFGAEYYVRSPLEDPRGPEQGRRRASRGGSWRHQVKFNRCAARSSLDPGFRYNDYGFRVFADA